MPLERIPDTAPDELRVLFGPMDKHLRGIRERFGVRVTARRGALQLDGDDERAVKEVAQRIRGLLGQLRTAKKAPEDEVVGDLLYGEGEKPRIAPIARRSDRRAPRGESTAAPKEAGHTPPGLPRPLTPNQERYVKAIRGKDVVFSIGPAGTGKTYLAVAEAVAALRADEVRKLVLTRPAVEAGEKLGFLPGDFQAKINPYLRPLYDALGELLPYGEVKRALAHDVIEIVPLAYMRGRTLKDAFIILDEAQNTTASQMKMFLTRMGMGSKMVVNGDVTQVDLPEGATSGLIEAIRILEGVKGIDVVRLGPGDILRHPLVQRIVDAYERLEDPRRATARNHE